MTDRRLTPRRLQRVAIVWAATGVLLALLQRLLWDALWVAAIVPLIAYAAAGVVFLLAALGCAWRDRGEPHARRGFALAVGILLVAGAALALGGGSLTAAGDRALVRLRFERHRAAYERVVREVTAGAPRPGARPVAGPRYHVDSGPPVRVAFPQPGGIIDNWEGVVYDPTGEVRAARGWRFDRGRQEFTAPASVRTLFGGDLVGCRSLGGPWYICSFT